LLYTPYEGGWDVGIPLIGPRPYAILYTPYGGGWDVVIPLIGASPYARLLCPLTFPSAVELNLQGIDAPNGG